MAQDIGQDIATSGPSVTMPTSDVTDGSNTGLFGSVDFGTPTPIEIAYEWIQTTLTSADGPIFLYVHWSHDNSTFSDIDNGELIAVMDSTASTDVEDCGSFPCRARYAQFSIHNESGGSLDFTSSNSAITLWDNFFDQA